jgi:hypothetical protein
LQTQRNLQHLEILPSGAVDAHHDPNTKDGCTAITDCLERAGLEQLQSVRVVPDIPQIAALCSIALQKSNSQTVISLEVDARHWVDAAHFAHAQNSMATKDQLVESLFAHLPRASPGHKGPFDNLTTLVLRDVKLNLSKYTWFTYLSLSKLQRLELHHCKAADIFLLQLTSGPEVPALKAFSMVHDLGENSHDRSILGIEQLLQDTGNGMVELELCLRNAPELPEVTSIARHGGSLRRLTLDIGSAKTCLRRGRAPRPLGGVCPTQTTSNRSARCQSRVQHTLCQIPRIRALHHKHRLEVLSLLSLPTDYTTIQSIGFFAAKDYALGRLAAEIFAVHRSHATSLQVIAFGTRERADSHLGPLYFVPYEYTIKNQLRAKAEQVSFTDLQKDAWTDGVLGYERRDFDAASRKLFHPVEKEGRDWQGQEDSWPTEGAW